MSSPLRVLIIETQSEPGGMWHYASALSRALADAGLEIALSTITPFEPLPEHGGLRVCSLGARGARSRVPAGEPLRRGFGQADRWRRLWRLVRDFRPDLVHLQNRLGKFDFAGFRGLRALGIPLVLTAHEPRPDTGLTWFDWARYRTADAVVVHSLNGVRDLVAGGVAPSRITRVHHGSYLHLCRGLDRPMDEARRALGLPRGARLVLFFGTIAHYKGLDILIDAFARVRAGGPDAYLAIAGEPLEDFGPYRRQIDALGLAGRTLLDLRYIPFDEMSAYFRAADAVAFPYRYIYQSGVLQLAYGYARPVVATDVGGLGEVVAEDRSGLVVPPRDPAALAAAIRQVLGDPGAAREMGARGRLVSQTKYSWEAVAREIVAVYRGVTAAAPAGAGRLQGAPFR